MRKLQKNNKTGFRGVCESYARSGDGRIIYPVVRAYIERNKKVYTQNFYLKNYLSLQAAIASAAIWREAKRQELRERKICL